MVSHPLQKKSSSYSTPPRVSCWFVDRYFPIAPAPPRTQSVAMKISVFKPYTERDRIAKSVLKISGLALWP